MLRLAAFVVLLLMTFCVEPGHVQAQSEEDLEEASALVEAADAAASSSDDAVALTLYEDAYRLNHDPELLYKVGVSAQRAGDRERARESFTRYLAEAEDGDNRDEAEERLEALAEPEVVPNASGTGSTTSEDGSSEDSDSTGEPGFFDTVPMLSYVLAGTGVALLTLGVVFALVGDGNYDAIQSDCTALIEMGMPNCNALVDDRWGGEVFIFDVLTWTSWVLAAGAFGAAVYFYLDANNEQAGEEVAIGLTPAGLFARWTF